MQTNFRNSTGTRSGGKQWTFCALNIFETIGSSQQYQTLHIESAFEFYKCTSLDNLYIDKFYSYIHGKYNWNHSVMLTNNACFMKRNIVVKHMTRKVYAITKNIVALTHCAFKEWSMFKVMNIWCSVARSLLWLFFFNFMIIWS